jgi:glycosyltransferase involved in cell wall biosynthesis
VNVSIIIPCYNAEPYLAQAIGSVLEQTRPPEELIVVDDGSTDGSRAIAESFGNRVRVLSRRSGSASRTRILGASEATGDALMFFDADDVLGPTALQVLVEELERHPEGVAACPWFRLELRDNVWVRRPPSCTPRRPGQDALEAWIDGWYHPPCSVLWSRVAYEQAGGWDERGGPNDDGFLMMRALAQEVPLRLTAEGAAYYRRLPQGTTSFSGMRLTEEGLQAWVWVMERIAELLEERGRLEPYRRALDDAFGRLAADCGDRFPTLAALCLQHQRTYGDAVWQRRARVLRRRLRSGFSRFRRVLAPPVRETPPAPEPPEEVRFGLDAPTGSPSS